MVDRTLSKRRSARSSVVVVPDARGRVHRGWPLLPPGRLPPAHRADGPVSGWAVGEALPPPDRGRDPVRGRQRHQVAGPAGGLPALADASTSVSPPGRGSVRAAATVGRATRGWDGGKKLAGRKRHIVVDTPGPPVAVPVTPASTRDRVAARSPLRRLRDTAGKRAAPAWADGGYTGPLLDRARKTRPGGADRSTPAGAVLHRAAQEVGGRTKPCPDHRTPPPRA
ncbi:hypothetical protein EKG83_27525 [Saccharothrix syringae]|uniref:Transposase IS4-like domain-containing protein n=1 Tax=Saccharothrix syringae TaxID=103733 RepID=A0A5Q0HDZ0_SACSY|nr:hypothetical protein EKG83_27525 [Saccharothrix syringae]